MKLRFGCRSPALAISLLVGSLHAASAMEAARTLDSEPSDGSTLASSDVYARVPARDEYGRDQLAMFRVWNPDPIRRHETNLHRLNPLLAAVVRKAQRDNPGLRFVIGSGKRDRVMQRRAVAWGWSKTPDSPHLWGDAVDLWPLDPGGRVHFDAKTQNMIGAAMRKAAAKLGVVIRWGGTFQSFQDRDRSHFELAVIDEHRLNSDERTSSQFEND